ncbi:hypothetical protein [Aquimarina algicola]|nr:hypothetical protein [Aquimarina algicola]
MNRGNATVFLAPTGSPLGEVGKGGLSAPNNYEIAALNAASGGEPAVIY